MKITTPLQVQQQFSQHYLPLLASGSDWPFGLSLPDAQSRQACCRGLGQQG